MLLTTNFFAHKIRKIKGHFKVKLAKKAENSLFSFILSAMEHRITILSWCGGLGSTTIKNSYIINYKISISPENEV